MEEKKVLERPADLICEIHRYTIDKTNWLIFIGLLDGKVFEVFAGDFQIGDDDTISIPKSIKKGQIIKSKDNEGNNRYDLLFKDKHGFKVTIQGIGRIFDKSYFNYIICVSFLLRSHSPEKVAYIIKKWKELDTKNEQLQQVLIQTLEKYLQK